MQLAQTLIANLIDKTDTRAQYDEEAKRLLSLSEILAWILHSCVDEFKSYDVPFIMKNCFVGKPIISVKAVHPDMPDKTDNSDKPDKSDKVDNSDKPDNQYVQTMNSESSSIDEETIYFDVRFKVRVPNTGELIEIIIDLEIQKDSSEILKIIRRGIYYCSRLISEQYGTEFKGQHYEKIKKVISIWICPSAADTRQDSIAEIRNTANVIHGNFKMQEKYYDLSRVIIICLSGNEKSEQKIIRLLSVYLSDKTKPEDKKYILEHEFNIQMTEEMERGIDKMYTLSNALIERTAERTRREERTRLATNLLKDKETKSISYVARMTELPEDVVRGIAVAHGIQLQG